MDVVDDLGQSVFGRYVEVGGKDGGQIEAFHTFSRDQFDTFDTFHLVAPKNDPDAPIGVGQVDVDRVAPHPEGGAGKIRLRAGIQDIDQGVEKLCFG